MLAKAKTGTGKTLSFLLPAIEGVARTPRSQRRGISVLIISPTRELAQQIADEANQVLVRVRGEGGRAVADEIRVCTFFVLAFEW